MSSPIIAKRYAKAFYDSLKTADERAKVLDEILLIAECIDNISDFRMFLKSPNISQNSFDNIIDSVFKKNLSETVIMFINFVYTKQRLDIFDKICMAFIEHYREKNEISIVDLESAFELTTKETENLTAMISKKLKQKIELSTKVNPELLGGIRFSTNNEIYDFTLANELAKFKRQLINA